MNSRTAPFPFRVGSCCVLVYGLSGLKGLICAWPCRVSSFFVYGLSGLKGLICSWFCRMSSFFLRTFRTQRTCFALGPVGCLLFSTDFQDSKDLFALCPAGCLPFFFYGLSGLKGLICALPCRMSSFFLRTFRTQRTYLRLVL